MQVTVQLTKAELAEMEVTGQQLESGIIQCLDGGIEIDGAGKVDLAGFHVDIQVVD